MLFRGQDTSSVGIVGVGMIGGSIALAALRAGHPVFLYDSMASGALAESRFRGASVVSSLAELVSQSRLIILAVPIGALAEIGRALAQLVQPGQVVSDVASVKQPAVSALVDQLRDRCDYVPSHPMAGSEKSGAHAARDDLFEGAVTLISGELVKDPASVKLVTDFWTALGTRVVSVRVPEHDKIVALMSHLPHLLAALLVKHVWEINRDALDFCGSGFRDTTRIASGSPGLWTDILLSNADAVGEQVRLFRLALEDAERLLVKKDAKKLQALLDDAKQNRDRLSP
jgi:prephenate dehydrogenase